jgi:lambda repressor-like predicted transcriptional regulator
MAMQAASLKEQFINVITYNHGRELWYTRPTLTFEETIGELVDELIVVTKKYKAGENYELHHWDEDSVVGRNIRRIQDDKGWSIARLARESDLNEDYLRGVQLGESLLGMWALMRIADALGVQASDLLPY